MVKPAKGGLKGHVSNKKTVEFSEKTSVYSIGLESMVGEADDEWANIVDLEEGIVVSAAPSGLRRSGRARKKI
jgi:hypothetical protein